MSLDRNILTNVIWGLKNNSLEHVFHMNNDGYNVNDGTDQVQITKHSPYYDNEILLPKLSQLKDNFTILSTNIECRNAKFNELDVFVHDLREKGFEFNAIYLQESWQDSNYDCTNIKLKGYECIAHIRRNLVLLNVV